MFISRIALRRNVIRILEGVALLLFVGVLDGAQVPAGSTRQTNPWSMSQVIQPADLAKELGRGPKPEIVCVGFNTLYQGAHIPGAAYHGPVSKPEGLEDLKQWARGIPRGQRIVVYCGCCPMDRCPNVRPAFQALKEMGFTNLRILSIPQDLSKDWVEKGFPVEKAR
jgi:thiosulfate/3-mercaptopyruvate sulfurtransferase